MPFKHFCSDLQKLEDCDRRAIHQIDQLQREQRHLKRQLEKLGIERIRMDSTGSTVSSERSDSDRGEPPSPLPAPPQLQRRDQKPPNLEESLDHGAWAAPPHPLCLALPTEEIDVDVESTDYLTGDLDWSSSSVSDSDERGSMQSLGSDEGYSSSSIQRIKLQDNHQTCLGL